VNNDHNGNNDNNGNNDINGNDDNDGIIQASECQYCPKLCVRAAGEQASVVAVMGSMHQTCGRDAAMPCGAVCWFDHYDMPVYLRDNELIIWYDADVSCATMYRKSE
jgi:hypothetical protein